jgi:hypothetical protein
VPVPINASCRRYLGLGWRLRAVRVRRGIWLSAGLVEGIGSNSTCARMISDRVRTWRLIL